MLTRGDVAFHYPRFPVVMKKAFTFAPRVVVGIPAPTDAVLPPGSNGASMPGPVFLNGDTVALRTVENEDLEFVQRAKNDRRVWATLGWPWPANREQLENYYEETMSAENAVFLLITVDGESAGVVSLGEPEPVSQRAELGYWIHPDHQGNGYATEAAGLLVAYGFRDLGIHRVEAKVFDGNEASMAVLESIGFEREGVHRKAAFSDGAFRDVHWFGLLAKEFDRRAE